MLEISYMHVTANGTFKKEKLRVPEGHTIFTKDAFFGKLLVALAANAAGDATALYEWFESQIRPVGEIEEVCITIGYKTWILGKSKDYSSLVSMPQMRCTYNGRDVGCSEGSCIIAVEERDDAWRICCSYADVKAEETAVFNRED